MAEKKFLDVSGVGRLWSNIVKTVNAKVNSESERAKAEEARIESLIISGGGGASVDVAEGEGIDIATNENGQKVISIEEESISDKHIDSISLSKVTLKDGDTLILNGGNANG
jgi:hypothetical protein